MGSGSEDGGEEVVFTNDSGSYLEMRVLYVEYLLVNNLIAPKTSF